MSNRMSPGYGRGWGEEKAKGRIARFRQYMREPATEFDLIIIIGLSVIAFSGLKALIRHFT